MSTSAQNQSIENVSIPDVLNAGIPAIIQNIRAAQRRVSCDDLTARFFDNAVQSAEMLHAQLIDVYNAEADSHNSLVDAAENMQLDLGLKGKEIEELQLQIEHLKGFVNGMVASHLLCHSGTINRHSLNGALLS